MDYKDICQQVADLAIEAGKYIRSEIACFDSSRIETKGKNDFVSYVDKTTEKILVEKLSEIVPEAGFIAEEGTRSYRGEIYNWVVDPLDGTTNFIHGLFPVCISIALMENSKTVVGVVYEIGLNECYTACLGQGAFMNGKPIHVSGCSSMQNSLVATGFPSTPYDKVEQFSQSMDYISSHTQSVRRIGSAATDLIYVACGRFDSFYEFGLSPWDVAAGALIVEEAGGIVSDFSGGRDFVFGKEMLATCANVYDEYISLIKKYMQ